MYKTDLPYQEICQKNKIKELCQILTVFFWGTYYKQFFS